MAPWSRLSADEMQLLETTFWSAGGSRHGMAEQLGFSKSKANALIAGLVEQGLLAEAGLQRSSGGRRPENLQTACGPGRGGRHRHRRHQPRCRGARRRPAVLAHHGEAADVREGPGVVLARVRALVRELLARCRLRAAPGDRHRHRRARPGQLRDRPARQPAADAGLGQLLDPRLPARGLRRAGVRRQRRQPDGARRAVAAAALAHQLPGDQGRHRHRLRHRLPRRGLPRRRRLGRRRRPHLRRPGGAALPLRQPGLRRGDGGRSGDHADGGGGGPGRREHRAGGVPAHPGPHRRHGCRRGQPRRRRVGQCASCSARAA